jgi:pSer/pThr/pTyr-binding forkhead associated (FHA) protein
MAVLIQYRNGIASIKIQLEHLPLSIGRGEENGLQLDDQLVSRSHASIEPLEHPGQSQTEYILRDHDSTNGSFVNHQRISAHLLVDGDMLRIGQSFFLFNNTEQGNMNETRILKKSFIPGVYYTQDKPK